MKIKITQDCSVIIERVNAKGSIDEYPVEYKKDQIIEGIESVEEICYYSNIIFNCGDLLAIDRRLYTIVKE